MKKNILFCILSAIFVSGCSSFAEQEEKAPVPTYEPNIVSEKEVHDAFIQAAKNVDQAFKIYTEVNNAAKREELTYEKIRQANWRVSYVPVGLERKTTFTWNGPVRPLLNQLSKESDYKIKFVGELPPVPHVVSVVANNDTLIDVLRDIAAKTDGLLDINIHDSKENKMIEVKYVDGFK